MSHVELQMKTEDGVCPTHVFQPDGHGGGPWPAVIVYIDGIGMRPAMLEIAEHIAGEGYYTVMPDLFYRVGFTGRDGAVAFSTPAGIEHWKQNVLPSASPANIMRDTDAVLAYLAGQESVSNEKIGITGYCMGGRLSLYAAGHFGARVAAAASYHGGGLATDAPDSPHRLAPQMKGRVYVGGAIEDRGFDDAQKARLERALTEAGVDHTIETYNARHGWVPSDTAVHDPVATERHWETLFALFRGTLSTRSGQA